VCGVCQVNQVRVRVRSLAKASAVRTGDEGVNESGHAQHAEEARDKDRFLAREPLQGVLVQHHHPLTPGQRAHHQLAQSRCMHTAENSKNFLCARVAVVCRVCGGACAVVCACAAEGTYRKG
jgi:hypothetical protein